MQIGRNLTTIRLKILQKAPPGEAAEDTEDNHPGLCLVLTGKILMETWMKTFILEDPVSNIVCVIGLTKSIYSGLHSGSNGPITSQIFRNIKSQTCCMFCPVKTEDESTKQTCLVFQAAGAGSDTGQRP